FQLRRNYEERLVPTLAGGPPGPEEMRQRMEAQKLYEEQVKAALGDQRYADYQRATDYNYRQTSQLVARLGLPAETAGQVYALQKETQQRIGPIFGNRELSPEARNEQISALAAEVETKLIGALGGVRGYE